jgi:hypothetical protein
VVPRDAECNESCTAIQAAETLCFVSGLDLVVPQMIENTPGFSP